MKKLIVRKQIGEIDLYDLEGHKDYMVQYINSCFENCEKGYENIEAYLEHDDYRFIIYGERLENNREFNKRKRQITRLKEQKKKNKENYKKRIEKEAKKLGLL